MQDYSKGILSLPQNHLKDIPEYIFQLDSEKKVYVKVMEEAKYRSYEQIKGFKGLTRILHESNCMNEKLDTWEKVQYYFKFRCGLIKHYVYVEKGKTTFHDTKINDNCYAEVKSCSTMLKKELKELIDSVCIEGDKQVDNMNPQMQKKWVDVRKKMEEMK